ncbi:transcriptional Coactivator p15-domain-containing protein [Elsinoe ampelina]|uniref:Transcriptional Coactivator p15-domain-containing protein n=1 Tax=Elsinoe ampelina TaxID=302913 RepID=A0A6A6GQT7_9PEZI|nr:transcriptional Coactivator p15-domain-containing protein [Elsinoe ampelina]
MPKFKSAKRALDADSDSPPAKRGKSSTASAPGTALGGNDGEMYWELSNNRRVSITSFKGKSMVNIREYYEKDGKQLPGKKGIAMPMEQYEVLLGLLPQIEDTLKKQGIEVGRPSYSGKSTAPAKEDEPGEENDQEEADEEEEGEGNAVGKPVKEDKTTGNTTSRSKLDRFKFDKGNHEATSDEEE